MLQCPDILSCYVERDNNNWCCNEWDVRGLLSGVEVTRVVERDKIEFCRAYIQARCIQSVV